MNKRVLFINLSNAGSTGTICKNIGLIAKNNGYEPFYIWGCHTNYKTVFDTEHEFVHMKYKKYSRFIYKLQNKLTNLSSWAIKGDGFTNLGSFRSMKKTIDKINPDVIHLHNLHGSKFNLPLIIKYCKKKNIPIVYTLHDCWPFTGYCPYFLVNKCDEYLNNQCKKCDYLFKYPLQRVRLANKCFKKKYKSINSYKNITFVGVSNWITDLAKNAPITRYHNVITILNGLDLDVFKINKDKKVFNKYDIPFLENYAICVSSSWFDRKGIQYLNQIASELKHHKINLLIVGRGLDNLRMPNNVYIINQVKCQKDLASLYSFASVTINPTLEESFSLVNLESVACHTPVVSFDSGGCKEAINGAGVVVNSGDVDDLIKEAINVLKDVKTKFVYKPYKMDVEYKKYIQLYDKLLKEKFDEKQ